jgi:hypothetical protein
VDSLTAFGLGSVSAMLVFYALEDRGPAFILAFAAACVAASAYGFLQGGVAVRCGRSDLGADRRPPVAEADGRLSNGGMRS